MLKRRTAFVALALCLVLIVDSSGQSQRPPPRTRESVQPPISKPANPAQPPASDQRGTEQSPVVVKVLPSDDEKQKAAAEAKREEQKTTNDENLARFTENLFWATVALSVIATLQLFVFGWQGIQLKRSVDLANREFIAGHRPELIVREITWAIRETTVGAQGEYDAIAFTLINRGRNSCEIVESVFGLSPTDGNGQAMRTWGRNQLGPVIFAAGQFRTYSHGLASELEHVMAATHALGTAETHYFRGTVIYADAAKIQRRFAFTRECMRGTGDRFSRTGNSEDEYND